LSDAEIDENICQLQKKLSLVVNENGPRAQRSAAMSAYKMSKKIPDPIIRLPFTTPAL
jgi:hypothetical protein